MLAQPALRDSGAGRRDADRTERHRVAGRPAVGPLAAGRAGSGAWLEWPAWPIE